MAQYSLLHRPGASEVNTSSRAAVAIGTAETVAVLTATVVASGDLTVVVASSVVAGMDAALLIKSVADAPSRMRSIADTPLRIKSSIVGRALELGSSEGANDADVIGMQSPHSPGHTVAPMPPQSTPTASLERPAQAPVSGATQAESAVTAAAFVVVASVVVARVVTGGGGGGGGVAIGRVATVAAVVATVVVGRVDAQAPQRCGHASGIGAT